MDTAVVSFGRLAILTLVFVPLVALRPFADVAVLLIVFGAYVVIDVIVIRLKRIHVMLAVESLQRRVEEDLVSPDVLP